MIEEWEDEWTKWCRESAVGCVKRLAATAAACAAAAVVAASLIFALTGCSYRGAKVVEGVDFAAGISIPGTEGAAELNFVNYLSGFRLGVERNRGVKCEFWGTNTFSFAWGLWESSSGKHFTALVPCVDSPTNTFEEIVSPSAADAGTILPAAKEDYTHAHDR